MIDQTQNLRRMIKIDRTSEIDRSNKNFGNSLLNVKKTGTCKSISILSGKGGVGKSITTILLGHALTRIKKRVLILDGDFGLANLHILLGIAPKHNLSHFINEECALSDIIYEGPGGMSIIPGSSGLVSMADMELTRLEYLIREFSLLESRYDFFLIDSGAGIGRVTIQLCCSAEHALIIVVPEPTSLADAYSTIKVLSIKSMRKISIVVNMAHSEREGKEFFLKLQLLVKNFLQLSIELVAIVPFDRSISQQIRLNRDCAGGKKSSMLLHQINTIAFSLCNGISIKPGTFFSRFFT